MASALARVETPLQDLSLAERAAHYADAAVSNATRRAYRADLHAWALWAMGQGVDPDAINPVTVAAYVTAQAGTLKVATLSRRLSGLNAYQRARGGDPVSVRVEPLRSVWQGVQRVHGEPQTRKAPVNVPDMRRMIAGMGEGAKAQRDAAIFVIGFAGAMRRADIVGLDWSANGSGAGYIEQTPDGLLVRFRRSKTDQTGVGEVIGLPYGAHLSTCPVRQLAAWRALVELQHGEASGPIFRRVSRHGAIGSAPMDGGSIARMVKARIADSLIAQGEGREEADRQAESFAGHSLRAGFVTSAFQSGVAEAAIMPHTRHKRAETLYKYRRNATVFVDNPGAAVGL